MGIKKVDRLETIDFVSLHDDALDLDAMGDEAISEFTKTRKKELLKLKEGKEPTIFKLKPNMSVRGSARVQNNSFEIGTKGDDSVKVLFGNIANDSLKEILVDIINPSYFKKGEGITFKKDGDGRVNDFCLEEIPNLIRVEISTFYLALQKQTSGGDLKKN